MSHSDAGGISAVLDHDTVGNDISSATQGSSVASVAGKNRAPTKQCANALEVDASAIELASAKESSMYRDVGKKRLPTISWATPLWKGTGAAPNPNRPARKSRKDIVDLRNKPMVMVQRPKWPQASQRQRGRAGPRI